VSDSTWLCANCTSGAKAQVALSGTTESTLVQGFNNQAQEEGELSASLEWQGGHWAMGLKPSVVTNATDDETYRYDGSYLAGTFGNLVIGAGALRMAEPQERPRTLDALGKARAVPNAKLVGMRLPLTRMCSTT